MSLCMPSISEATYWLFPFSVPDRWKVFPIGLVEIREEESRSRPTIVAYRMTGKPVLIALSSTL